METERPPRPIWLIEDDADDQLLIREAFEEAGLAPPIPVTDGETFLERLRTAISEEAAPPALVLLDLNLPRQDGREVLRELKASPLYRAIPVLVLTTSQAEEDVNTTYALGAASYFIKPVSFDALVEIASLIRHYWLEGVELPTPRGPFDDNR